MTDNTAFLEKVKNQGHLEDIYDARDVTEVVYRTMRDLMSTEAADRVGNELRDKKEAVPSPKEVPQKEVADLWKDTNPIVGFLSRVRPPLNFDGDTFLFRISQEASLPKGVAAETVVQAIFSATKEQLSPERVEEIATFLPDKIRQMWKRA
ncbi:MULTISPECIES: DUF2267 domain-containing protein [unclassified Coleofasciculus]|uniref:DUF2267 domain-containing protein n=1 Tax=unclassified Coleofasciculus TaxID=2692782 RepID=UPI00188087C1|nr:MULTISPECIES: DUF2267 domain-containing protein [unclassified Coleofasciculus]MBE9130110.1 DUF2267 domain-containing protein [Coleofasciculus sp. LEGE 07081]MBE9147102.1 DUF2267 domain-containing protein [Coleofasciculus sp. LEGE 07092]